MLAVLFHAGCGLEQGFLCLSSHRNTLRERAAALCQRARFIDHNGIYFFESFEHRSILDKHPFLGTATNADHDRQRRGEPQSAWAGNDQHGHCVDKR